LDKSERRQIYETEMVRLRARRDFERQRGRGWLALLLALLVAGGVIWISRRAGMLGGPGQTDSERLFARIETAVEETDTGAGASSYDAVAKVLAEVEDPAELAGLVRLTSERLQTSPAHRRVCLDGRSAALDRLVELGDPDAAAALVGLLRDAETAWDEHAAREITWAIAAVGSPCLPYLLEVSEDHARKDWANRLVAQIRRDRPPGG